MLTASALYRQALPTAAARVTRVEVFHSGTRVGDFTTGLVVGGQVTARLTAQVTRNLTMQVDPAFYPTLPSDLFSAEQAIVKVSSGIGYPDGSREIFPIFTGRVYDVQEGPDGGVTLLGEDRAAEVLDFPFEQPVTSILSAPITSEIRRLIVQAIPDAVFGSNNVIDALTPTLVWDDQRGKALDDLAAAVQGRWYTLGDGSFVVRKYPYVGGTPVISLLDQSGGVVITATVKRTRRGVANSVTVIAERMDGTTPIRVTQRQSDPASPFYFGGPYGRVSQIVKVQTPLTAAEAQALAQARLMTAQALAEQWTINAVPDYTLEPGDTIHAEYRSHASDQVIDTITWPLVQGDMTLQTRASIPA